MNSSVSGPALLALESLDKSQIAFLSSLPKAELHAHLHGSISLECLRALSKEFLAEIAAGTGTVSAGDDEVLQGIRRFESGVQLNEIGDFFGLFPSIYKLISTRERLQFAARSILNDFLGPPFPPTEGAGASPSPAQAQCAYLELRSTPRSTPTLSRQDYLEAVLDEIELYPPSAAAFIVSLDRRMSPSDMSTIVSLAISLKQSGRRVVGIDLCGDPLAGDPTLFKAHFLRAKEAGLGVTLHIAETSENTEQDTRALLECQPERLGHATFLSEEMMQSLGLRGTCVEICLTSNLVCKTVKELGVHHVRWYLEHKHPIAICVRFFLSFCSFFLSVCVALTVTHGPGLQTDDVLPFRTNMLAEYALLMAKPPLGLGLTVPEIGEIARMSMRSRFGPKEEDI
jgi:adenosine deaminase